MGWDVICVCLPSCDIVLYLNSIKTFGKFLKENPTIWYAEYYIGKHNVMHILLLIITADVVRLHNVKWYWTICWVSE